MESGPEAQVVLAHRNDPGPRGRQLLAVPHASEGLRERSLMGFSYFFGRRFRGTSADDGKTGEGRQRAGAARRGGRTGDAVRAVDSAEG